MTVQVILSVAGAVITGLFIIIAFFARKIVEKQDALGDKLTTIDRSVADLRLEIARDYVKREELEKDETAHKDLRIDITKALERVAVLEALRAETHGQ